MSKSSPIHTEDFWSQYGDLGDILPQILELFDATQSRLMGEIEQAIGMADAGALKQKAHALKGTIAQIFAPQGAELARRLEALGREGTIAGAAPILAELKAELVRINEQVAEIRKGLKKTA